MNKGAKTGQEHTHALVAMGTAKVGQMDEDAKVGTLRYSLSFKHARL